MDAPDADAFESIPDAVLVVDKHGSIVFANGQAEELFGYDPGEMVGLTVEALVPERSRHRHEPLRRGFAAAPAVRPMGSGRELHALRKDAREFPAEIAIGPTKDGRHTVAVIRDVTVALETRAELKASEKRFRVAAQSTADLVYEGHIPTDSIVWFGDVDGALGYEAGEFPRSVSGFLESLHPDDREEMERTVQYAVATGDKFHAEYRMRRADETYAHWEGRGAATEFGDGKATRWVGSVTDITERTHLREELEHSLAAARQQAELNTLILSSIADHIAVLDLTGEIIAVNDAWRDFARLNGGKETLGVNYIDVCRNAAEAEPSAQSALVGILSVLDSAVSSFRLEYPCHHASQERWFAMVASAMKNGSGAVIVHSDLTPLLKTQHDLELALSEVERLKDRLESEADYLQEELKRTHHFDQILGNSDPMLATLRKVERVAPTDSTVLIIGETGTGKELLARAVHAHSSRKDRPLIKIDCTTLPSGLVESELFGHTRGAFTGALESKTGRFELADGGTIFLDEIGELSLDLQTKLLRVLQDGEFEPLGSTSVRKTDVRIIAATNRSLRQEMDEGHFRPDLYYRLSVVLIEAPPLRERREDIPLLVSYFVEKSSAAAGKRFDSVAEPSMGALVAYDWPGNVRELQNVIERAVVLSPPGGLTIQESLGDSGPPPRALEGSLNQDLHSVERSRILRALQESGWKVKGDGNAASRLGLKPSTLQSRMKRLGIKRP